MIMNSYKSKEESLMFLLSSEDFLQAMKRSDILINFPKDRKEYLKNLKLYWNKIEDLNSLKDSKKQTTKAESGK